ncbi:glycosyltransferase family 4 protein [Chelativorans sp. J32]|uniref:glycosyltransferase family 4 protein n=1 Tax=Chelativorans sp. J32 TaxID=935840 RepID=UPI000488E456|nr:glycosyltransferase family 4 protein [Chelativorans sp. J32]
MKPDRVVIINDRSTAVGGASNLSLLLRGFLEERGVPVTFFAGDQAGSAGSDPGRINLDGRPLLERGRAAAFVAGIYNAPAHAALERFIRSSDTASTIYHVHGWSKILSPAIFRALRDVRERVVLHAHDYFLVCPNGGFVNYPGLSVCNLTPMSLACLATQCDKRGFHQKLWRSVRHGLRQMVFDIRGRPAHIVLVHEAMQHYFDLAGVARNQMVTVRNPFEPFLQEMADPANRRNFFFIGRLEPEKGFEDAARAARMAGVPLHVIGEGAGRALLEKRYPEVVLHGWRKHEEIAGLVVDARAVVISSRVPEPFGLAALEALGSGIPVILPREALLSREIVEAGCGLSFKAGDVAELTAAMRRLAEDDHETRDMGRIGFREAPRMGHTGQTWTDALMALYGTILQSQATLH